MEIPMGLYARPLRSRLRVDRLRQIGWTRLHVGKALRWCNVQRPLDLITRFRLSTSPRTATKSQRQLTCNHSMPSVPGARVLNPRDFELALGTEGIEWLHVSCRCDFVGDFCPFRS